VAPSEDNPLEIEFEKAFADYMLRCDSGSAPDREAFLSQHPGLREQLSELLSAADWIEQLAGPTLAASSQVRPGPDVSAKLPAKQLGEEETVTYYAGSQGHSDAKTLPISGPDEDRTTPLDGATLGPCEVSLDDGETGRGGMESSSSSPLALPCMFGDYRLERVLGRGGMGVVYYAQQIHLERPVAIKMIRSGALASSEEVQRFYAEARSAAKLDHRNIVTVYQCGECDGHRYFSMDYVPGSDLSRMIKQEALSCQRAARYVRDVARAIQYAHDQGILHRDLKPANVLVDEADEVRITDFGLAKSIGNDSGLTATGAALGTPSYMSPEQAAGRVDEQHHATDIYALGAILFTCVTGQPPFKSGSVVQTIMHVIHRPAPKASSFNKAIDPDIETIIEKCLQKSPERRYASAGALADDLQRFLQGIPIQARPMSRARRVWYWLLGVPIIGAVLDHRVVEPTEAHRWVQRGMISVLLLLILWGIASVWLSSRMPSTVRIAAGVAGSTYERVAQAIAQSLAENTQCTAIAVNSAGSAENVEKLAKGEVQLALLQADSTGDSNIAVIAPLFYEAIHLLVRQELKIQNVSQLAGRSVIVGSEKAGARSVSRLLFERSGISLDDITIDAAPWQSLHATSTADAAIVVSKLGAPDVTQLLRRGEYRLLPMSDSLEFALDEPAFHPLLMLPSHYPECGLPDGGIATIATVAFLVTRTETPNILVTNVLESLFEPAIVATTGILPADRAANWHGIAWHPAAQDFFQSYRGSSPTGIDRFRNSGRMKPELIVPNSPN
jgi:TRAP transporter TAXI family solute receptor